MTDPARLLHHFEALADALAAPSERNTVMSDEPREVDTSPVIARSHKAAIRQVSGWGARCGCGGESILHRTTGRPVSHETSTFLCHDCVEQALAAFRLSRPDQPPYWPGDEGRDERYVRP